MNEELIIRKAREEDAEKISKLIVDNIKNVKENNYSKEQENSWISFNSPEHQIRRLNDSNRKIFILLKISKILAVGSITKDGEIKTLYVNYKERGKGYGHKMFLFLENYSKENKIKKLFLTATPSAVKFYLSQGFRIIKTESVFYNGIYFLETKMEKKLK